MSINLKKGFDINLVGKAESNVVEVASKTFSIKPPNFVSFIKPKVLVKVGDSVKAGTTLYFDKSLPEVKYSSPVSGEVVEVKRGEKRKLLEIIVKTDGQNSYEDFGSRSVSEAAKLSAEEAKQLILDSGVWPNIIQRPYAVIAKPTDTPKAIFISGFDTNPLAPDYDVIFKGEEQNFQLGLEVLTKLTSGSVHLTLDGKSEILKVFSEADKVQKVQINKVSGPHPAGNVGVQIHHIDPINKGDIVWTLNPYGVIQIGRLFLQGRYDASRTIAVAGSSVSNPQYVKTYTGANIGDLTKGNLSEDHVRYISGSVLSGEKVEADGHMGYYDNALSVIPEGDNYKFFGSFDFNSRLSLQRAIGLFSFLSPKKEYVVDTNLNGEHRAFVQSGMLEKVLPMDIYPTYLLKAIIAKDFDEMEALGIYEVAEEDLALCEFVDVSKNDVQGIIREGIDLMLNS
ncbi:MAG: Na(+)-translocating NADH-quinone reductase subunit A [Cytophagales bacterium]|nr:Na(+)-translocating NADH-quinone reductase subunit A [Cytophagales bacterium]